MSFKVHSKGLQADQEMKQRTNEKYGDKKQDTNDQSGKHEQNEKGNANDQENQNPNDLDKK